MPVIIYDPITEQEFRAAREGTAASRRDEVWDGVLVVPPQANNEHQRIVMGLCYACSSVIDWDAGDMVLPGANVSDRDAGWIHNYRDPDVVVYLATSPALNGNTHWVGGPDLAVEVVSPGEDGRLKLDFYAKVGTREVLVVDRNPWALELYQLQGAALVSVGTSDVASGAVLTSCALPLTFQLQAGVARPTIHVAHTTNGQTWTA